MIIDGIWEENIRWDQMRWEEIRLNMIVLTK